MPGNGLALPVRVGGEVDFFAFIGRLLQLGNGLFLALDGLVVGFKVVVLQVHAHLALGQVPDVTHRGQDFVVRPQIFSDGLCFGR